MKTFVNALVLSSLAGAVLAHPGEDHSQEIAERRAFFQSSPKTLGRCASHLKARGTESRNQERRRTYARSIREELGIANHGKRYHHLA